MSDINLEEYRLKNTPTSNAQKQPITKARTRTGRFIKGPIPWDFITKSARLPGKTLHVVIGLCYLSGLKKTKTLKMQGKILEELGVSRHAYNRALKLLEKEGIISTQWRKGQTPEITLLLEL